MSKLRTMDTSSLSMTFSARRFRSTTPRSSKHPGAPNQRGIRCGRGTVRLVSEPRYQMHRAGRAQNDPTRVLLHENRSRIKAGCKKTKMVVFLVAPSPRRCFKRFLSDGALQLKIVGNRQFFAHYFTASTIAPPPKPAIFLNEFLWLLDTTNDAIKK